MSTKFNKHLENNDHIIVLAIGNTIMGDDGVAIEAARLLKEAYGQKLQVEEVFGGGLELLDLLEGKERALLIDSISTGKSLPGSIFELTENEFSKTGFNSSHYIGLPEILNISKMLEIKLPNELRILAVETVPQMTVREGLSRDIEETIPGLVNKAKSIIDIWLGSD